MCKLSSETPEIRQQTTDLAKHQVKFATTASCSPIGSPFHLRSPFANDGGKNPRNLTISITLSRSLNRFNAPTSSKIILRLLPRIPTFPIRNETTNRMSSSFLSYTKYNSTQFSARSVARQKFENEPRVDKMYTARMLLRFLRICNNFSIGSKVNNCWFLSRPNSFPTRMTEVRRFLSA